MGSQAGFLHAESPVPFKTSKGDLYFAGRLTASAWDHLLRWSAFKRFWVDLFEPVL